MDVIIVGASGYSGLELIRLLLQHPEIDNMHLFAHSQKHQSILEVFPHLRDRTDNKVEQLSDLDSKKLEELKTKTDIVFFATPSAVSKDWGKTFLKYGFKVIDLSGDYRLKNPKDYCEWYHFEHPNADLLKQAVYGLPEWFFQDIKEADYIANPGCYATSILLALAPLFKEKLSISSIIIDAKSGVSGAGKGFNKNTHYSEVNENLKVYKVGEHQHIPEIEQILSEIGNFKVTVQMIPHLIPMTRGILSTIYVDLDTELTYSDLSEIYQMHYKEKAFVRLRPEGEYPETKHVYGTNYCDIGFYVDKRSNRLIIFSAIDNLMKGAAGQAVQNLNIIMGWDEQLGLKFIPIYP